MFIYVVCTHNKHGTAKSAFVHLHNVHCLYDLCKKAQKAVVECVALRSWQVPVSNLDLETGYPARGFSQFSSVTQIRPRPLPFTFFPIR
jgi:hypothetical protein